MLDVLTVARYAVFTIFAAAVVVAFGGWLVRTRRVSPFKPVGRRLRSATNVVLDPVERRVVRMGGNPVHAGWWLIVVVAVGGVVFLSLLGWLMRVVANAQWAAAAGPRGVLIMIVTLIYRVLVLALVVRIVGAWLGFFRYNRWMRPVYALTDWIVEPLRRVVPPFGPFDVTPLVAWLLLWMMLQILLIGLTR